VKSDISDELINTFLLRPIAHLIVRALYHTPVTPNQVTVASIVAGTIAAMLYAVAGPVYLPVAGLCMTLKDLLDSADGQLARAKQMYSRFGRFLDSIGDFAVNLLVFAAISMSLFHDSGRSSVFLLGLAGFLGISLRVSYHVFYQTSFLNLQSAPKVNRITEEIQEGDLVGDRRALRMQRTFLLLYGWQDDLMVRLDRWSMKGVPETLMKSWYSDRPALVLSGFLGLATELFILMLFSLARRLDLYLVVNVVGLNTVWALCVVYRKVILTRALKRTRQN
jgi:hypothetical protein